MTRRLKLTGAGAGAAPSCLIRGCERVPRKGTKLCRVHAEALRPVPPAVVSHSASSSAETVAPQPKETK